MTYSDIHFKDFRITLNEIIQPEKMKSLTESYGFKHIRWSPIISSPGNPNILLNFPKIYFELGDFPFTDDIYKRVINNRIIFATNNESITNNAISLPIGVTSTSHCDIIGNINIICEQFKKEKQTTNLCYLNFNPKTHMQERVKVINKFKNCHWVTSGKFNRTHDGHKVFIEEIYNHKFIFCPRGNGVDTHRLWMSLYLGSIPIVKRDKILKPFEFLPILFIDDWDEITEEFLQQKYKEIHSKKYDFNILTMSYWKEICKNV